ncbi:ABC transporter ATP-binding protein [Sporolactobacillus sp. CPB3-1]|uniref:ABC transporter ATP-binding protein n=1 Tax=Sporolactobacillus mangiferae TaxID=2940498 RepID=A0ABT0M9P6_9BACL|nr:ABC transporter ATP-binding protein [Sporolactobacillus mangiferae]MCL1631601.1 ABC transporter ATP-binding protein [Sporolactobacillus mangiferae]
MKIELKDINFSYAGSPLFKGLDMVVEPGKLNLLIGYNGAGKTTLFDMLTGIITPQSGKIDGLPGKEKILYQTQAPALFGVLSGRDLQNFIFGTSNGYTPIDITSLSDRLQDLYEKLMNKKISVMSVGERRWLLTLIETHLDKKLFLFDEPTSGVDPVSRRQILDRLNDIVNGSDRIVIASTHELRDYESVASNIFLLNKGCIRTFQSFSDFVEISPSKDPNEAFERYVED